MPVPEGTALLPTGADPGAEENGAIPTPLRGAPAALAGLLAAVAATCLLASGPGGGGGAALRAAAPIRRMGDDISQVVYIMRHGDKYSSYPACKAGEDPVDGTMCFDSEAMGDNPPLTECGVKQANYTAGWIVNQSTGRGIANIVVSPFVRTLMTSLPLAKLLGKNLTVEPLLSEARQPEGPYRPYNVALPAFAVSQLAEIEGMWDPSYGSPPIKTPEDTPLYDQRVAKMAQVLKARFPPASGNLAVYTHATTSFSVAYGLCSNLFTSLQEFVDPMPAIAPAGVIVATLDENGDCTNVTLTQNVAEAVGCGETEPFKCEFEDYPNWYWEDALGSGPAKCH